MTIEKPEVTINIIPAYQKVENDEQRILFVGQMLTGTAIAGQLYSSIQNNNEQDALFGKASMLATMIKAAKDINKVSRIDAIPLADVSGGGATKAVGSIVFTAGPSVPGSITVIVGSSINHSYTLIITSASTSTTIGDALVAAFVADDRCPVTGVNTAGSVAITAKHTGIEGNKISLVVEGSLTGLTIAITAMTGGAINPTLTSIFDVIEGLRYQTIVYPSTYSTIELVALLNSRFNVNDNILDGIGILSITDTLADLKTLGGTLNTQVLAIHGNQEIMETYFKGSALLELDYIIASQIAAIRALRLTDGANISQYVISTNGIRDNTGGAAIASLPYPNTPFTNLPVIAAKREFTKDEIKELIATGIFVLGNNRPRNEIIAGDIVTTYKTDAAGNNDVSFKYMEYVDTSSTIREYFYNNLRTNFAQCRLTNGTDVIPNRNFANTEIIKSYISGLYADLASDDYVLTQNGEAARKFFLDNLSVELDLATGLVTVAMQVPLVTQLREIIANMQISFSTEN